jgi:hypothetical protein
MTYRDIDVNISTETKSMLLEVQKFSMEVMRPAGVKLDSLSAPEDVIAEGSALWGVFKGFRSMDLHMPWWENVCRPKQLSRWRAKPCKYSEGMGWLKNIPLRKFLEMHGPA